MDNQITCLRCRLCKLLPETDMEDVTPIVYCGKKEDKTPLILSGCGLADPRQYHCISEKSKRLALKYGNKLSYAGEVEEAWLDAHYERAPWEVIENATGRTRASLRTMAMRRSWQSDPKVKKYRVDAVKKGRSKTGLIFTKNQSEFIESCYAKDFWPSRGRNFSDIGKLKNQQLREVITVSVNMLSDNGKEWSWEKICRHISWTQPAYRRDGYVRHIKNKERKMLNRGLLNKKSDILNAVVNL